MHSIFLVSLSLVGFAGAATVDVWPTGSGLPASEVEHPAYPRGGFPCTEDLFNVQQAVFDAAPGVIQRTARHASEHIEHYFD